jgi:hypothetical protein
MDIFTLSALSIVIAELITLPISYNIAKILAECEDTPVHVFDENIKKDRLRYTKNTQSSTFALLAIVFNVLYFVSIYSSDVGNFYYSPTIGISVLCNLLFLLFTFLCSEGVKSYKMSYSIILVLLGAFQIVRIFGIPTTAHNTVVVLSEAEITVMDSKQFMWVCIWLVLSAISCFIAAAIGISKTVTLNNYKKQIANN